MSAAHNSPVGAVHSETFIDVRTLLAEASTPEVTLRLNFAPNLWYEPGDPPTRGRTTFWVHELIAKKNLRVTTQRSSIDRPTSLHAWSARSDGACALRKLFLNLSAQTREERVKLVNVSNDADLIKITKVIWTAELTEMRLREYTLLHKIDSSLQDLRKRLLTICSASFHTISHADQLDRHLPLTVGTTSLIQPLPLIEIPE